MIRLAAATIALLSLLASPPTRADDVAEARVRFRKGAELYRAGRWRDAIAEFEAAYRLKPAGAIHYNIAQCRERLAEWPGALRAYQDYLHEVPEAKDRAAVRAAIGRLEARLAAAGVQELVVYSDPPGATVLLDGRPRGKTPFHIVLPPGSYGLALSLDGYDEVKEEIALAAAASRMVDLVLRPAAAAASPPARAAVPQVPLPPPPDLKVQPPKGPASSALAAKAPAAKPEKRRVYTWIAAGTAVAAAAAGGYFGLAARRDSDAIRALSAPNGDEARRLTSSAQSKARAANVLYAVGGAAAAAGVTLFFVEQRF